MRWRLRFTGRRKKILCGEEANISQRDFDYAKQFVEVLIAPSDRTAEDAAHLQTLESLVNADLTTSD